MESRGMYVFLTLLGCVCAMENFALHKAAMMSTSQHTDKWLAGAAVDGNTDQTLEGNSCAVTSDNYNPEAWWKVDLGTINSIEKVKIYYRDENDGSSYTYRLSGFYIYVSNDSVSLGSSCYVNNDGDQANPGPNSITSFPCVATGRYVTIYKSRKNVCTGSIVNKNSCAQLELCEVEVLGSVIIQVTTESSNTGDGSTTDSFVNGGDGTSTVNSSKVGLAVGLSIGILVLIILLIVAIFLYRRGYFANIFTKRNPKDGGRLENMSGGSAGVINQNDDKYDVGQPAAVYSQVHKPSKSPEVQAESPTDPPLYAEVNKDKKKTKENGVDNVKEKTGTKNNANPQGLVYSDLQFDSTNPPPKPSRQEETVDERVAYASLEI